jgi:hypothetical protein
VRIVMFLMVTAIAGLATVATQGCFYHSWQDQGPQYGSAQTVCNTNGNNCMACDADNQNCHPVDVQSGSTQKSSWWFLW